jgi:predicted transcriptional regulator
MRTRRISSSAAELLKHLCGEHSRITYNMASGSFDLCINGNTPMRVPSRTVEVLASGGLIIKASGNGSGNSYRVTEHGVDMARQYVRTQCAALGHGYGCKRCTLDGARQ